MTQNKVLISIEPKLDNDIRTYIRVSGRTFSGYLSSLARKDLLKKNKEVQKYGINNTTQ